MKQYLTLFAAILGWLAIEQAAAAPMFAVKPIDVSPNNVYSFYVDGAELNGSFDTIYFQAKPTGGTFINQLSGALGGVPRPPGDLFSYPNRLLTADPLDFPGGLALTQVGLVNTPQELSFTVGKLGGTLTTADQVNGDLFLGNVNLSGPTAGFTFQVQLISAGNVIYDPGILVGPPIVPEPASFSIAALSFVGLMAAGRRRFRAE